MSITSSRDLPAFARSARFYDLICEGGQRRRDYDLEVANLAMFAGKLDGDLPIDPVTHRVLDWGCGTGEHVSRWPKFGWPAVGADPSPSMVAAAVAKGLDVREGSIVDSRIDGLFHLQTCLFAAFSYAAAGEDHLARSLVNVSQHAPRGGYFVFDVVNYSAAACFLRPIDRLEVPGLVRVMRKRFDLQDSLVNYSIDYTPADGETFTETHVLRAFTPREIGEALRRHGFDVLSLFDPESANWSMPTARSFYFMVVARKR